MEIITFFKRCGMFLLKFNTFKTNQFKKLEKSDFERFFRLYTYNIRFINRYRINLIY